MTYHIIVYRMNRPPVVPSFTRGQSADFAWVMQFASDYQLQSKEHLVVYRDMQDGDAGHKAVFTRTGSQYIFGG